MKKIIFILISMLMLSALAIGINAGSDYLIPNPPVTVEITSPTIDGNITKTEGWSDPAYMNEDTLIYNDINRALNIFAEVYFAADRQGFYFAADIKENIRAYAPDSNPPDISEPMTAGLVYSSKDPELGYLRNGDRFQFGIDPLGIMRGNGDLSYGFLFCPQYDIYIYEDGELRLFGDERFGERDADLTEEVLIEGSATEYGWCFEAWIPWDIIVEDMEFIADRELLSVENIISDGAVIRAGACYIDRWTLTEDGKKVTYNKYYTAESYRSGPAWNFGVADPEQLGIKINISDTCRGYGHRWSDWVTILEATYFEKGEQMSVCRLCGGIKYKTLPIKEYVNSFTDVKEASWYAKGVEYCIKRGYLSGMGNGRFQPNTALTREQCVVILCNILDVDFGRYANIPSDFEDVPINRWYSGAITWAVQQGYVKGMSEGVFGLGQPIQRAAFARLLYLLAQDLGIDVSIRADLTQYTDHSKIPSWAYEQLSWAVSQEIIISIKDDALVMSPSTSLKRAQCATMLMQFGKVLEEEGFYDDEVIIH